MIQEFWPVADSTKKFWQVNGVVHFKAGGLQWSEAS